MIRATQVLGQHRWTQSAADTVVLDFDDRHRRRMAMTGTRGLEFLLDLENAVALRGGDALVLEDGRLIEVVAAAEPLVEIRGADPLHLVRVAWHLGNRHLPTQIMPKGLRIRRDHVIEAMVKGLGARIIEIEAPFDPEGGAYAAVMPMRRKPTRMHMPFLACPCTMPMHDHPRMITITVSTITTTSIATTIITTTITPMLMTTSEPVPADAESGMTADEAAALYRLMTWLSPAFPVGAFSYSSGIEWAVEAGDITDAASLRDWLAAMLTEVGLLRRRVSGAGASRRVRAGTMRACARSPNLRQLSCPRASASSRRRRRAAPLSRSPDRRGPVTGSTAWSPLAMARSSIPSRSGSSARRTPFRWRRRCTPSCMRWCRTGFPPARGWCRSARPTASAFSQAWKPMSPLPQSARSHPRSTISAAPPSAPISPACVTRRNIRGCSGHDGAHSASSLRTQGPIATGLGCYRRRRPLLPIDGSRGMGPGVRRDDKTESSAHV